LFWPDDGSPPIAAMHTVVALLAGDAEGVKRRAGPSACRPPRSGCDQPCRLRPAAGREGGAQGASSTDAELFPKRPTPGTASARRTPSSAGPRTPCAPTSGRSRSTPGTGTPVRRSRSSEECRPLGSVRSRRRRTGRGRRPAGRSGPPVWPDAGSGVDEQRMLHGPSRRARPASSLTRSASSAASQFVRRMTVAGSPPTCGARAPDQRRAGAVRAALRWRRCGRVLRLALV
jgi:hypothetical protein